MEIRDPLHGSILISDSEKRIIDDRAFQRLREIKQLGFGEFSFPGGMHNRYIHSVGAFHLAGQAFDLIFHDFSWSSLKVRDKFRQTVKLAALLHDVGHGPLSHTTEEVMPPYRDLKLGFMVGDTEDRRATHEDYTIKILLDSVITKIIYKEWKGSLQGHHIAALICPDIEIEDQFFMEQGLNFRPILGQLISSELDIDRMDYLSRDAYYCGTNYGKIETQWLLSNLSYHEENSHLYLSLNQRALYAFEDFLLARHHMYLMVYFHHKSIIYDEMLARYFNSPDCSFQLPSDLKDYLNCTDHTLYTHMKTSHNEWARRIVNHDPYVVLYEEHIEGMDSELMANLNQALERDKVRLIRVNSQTQLSKYKSHMKQSKKLKKDQKPPMFIKDRFKEKAMSLEKASAIFNKYEKRRSVERLYVHPEDKEKGLDIIKKVSGRTSIKKNK